MNDSKKTILLVDDDPNVLEMIYEGLIAENFEVIAASNPNDALKKSKRRVLDFALLDLDLGWNYMTGIELGLELRANDENLVIIIMTGYHNIKFAVEAMRKHFFHYMIKPFRIDQVISLTERAHKEIQLKTENRELHEKVAALELEVEHLASLLDQIRPEEAGLTISSKEKDLSKRLKNADALSSYARQKGSAALSSPKNK